MTDSAEVATKLGAARTRLILEKPFIGALVMHLPLVEADAAWCKTIATDGRAFYFNSGYIATLDFAQTQFVLALGALVLWAALRLLLDPAGRRRVLHGVPVLGPLWRWTALAEFSHYLGLLVDCNLPLSRALPLAAQGTRDPELERACRRVADEVAAGRSLSEALSWWRAIPTGLVKLLRWSEGYQTPAEALHMAGALFEARARSQAEFLGAVAVVTAVILVIWGIALLVVALFMPLISLVSALSG